MSEIRTAREAAGITRSELAAKVGIAANTLWRYETGRTQPTVDRFNRIMGAISRIAAPVQPGASRADAEAWFARACCPEPDREVAAMAAIAKALAGLPTESVDRVLRWADDRFNARGVQR